MSGNLRQIAARYAAALRVAQGLDDPGGADRRFVEVFRQIRQQALAGDAEKKACAVRELVGLIPQLSPELRERFSRAWVKVTGQQPR